MEEKKPKRVYLIPRNYTRSRLGQINYRNIVETVIMVFIIHAVFSVIPFLLWVRIVTEIIIMVPLFILFLLGISDDSVTEYIIDLVVHRAQKCNAVLKISPRKKRASPMVAGDFLIKRFKKKSKGV